MNGNPENIFSKAARSNLTATALEFVPRSHSRSNSSNPRDCYNRRGQRGRFGGNHRKWFDERQDLHHDRNNRSWHPNVSERRYEHHWDYYSNNEQPTSQHRFHDVHPQEDSSYELPFSNVDEASSFECRNGSHESLASNKSELSTYNNHNNVYDSRDMKYRKSRNNTVSSSNSQSRNRAYKTFRNTSYHHETNSAKKNDKYRASNENDSICQRDRLIEQLNTGKHECLICCEAIKQREPIWNCYKCYYVLHMWCVIKWARSSKADSICWRCPACQHEYEKVPEKYMCFCGKNRLQTEWNRSDTAHSCGELCGRTRENPTPWFVCEHPCTLLCHPGPCPPCTILVKRECGCGRTQQNLQCSTKIKAVCAAICDRILNCGIHYCTQTCHFGECASCQAKIKIGCYCGKEFIERTCGSDEPSKFSCKQKCGKLLSCGNHTCEVICHEGECGLCPRDPIVPNTCACGKVPVSENTRQSCLDKIPSCDQKCGKIMKCGPPNRRHICERKCHEDDCGPCVKQTAIKCPCGALEKYVPCVKIDTKEADFRCQKKCTKKRSCGKHKCNQTCCVDFEHICSQRCNNSLNCGKHRCDLLCHRGKCGRCLESRFEELYCHCGHSVIYPPVPCGTKPPPCDQPCRREHDCQHPPLHTCHSDQTCPPCIVFTDKLCYGGHELRKTIPCYQREFSCGLPCNAPLSCGYHTCQIPCHSGECLSLNKKCTQPCTKPRDLCGHPCAAPCHSGTCPKTPCKEMVTVTCACGNIVAQHLCNDHVDDYRRIAAATLENKISELQITNGVNNSETNDGVTTQMVNFRTLECTDECKFIMRNRRLALALQIQNPDLSAKLAPKYSDFMKLWAKKDPNLCQHVHDKLSALVKLAKESKQKSRSYSFEIMNKEKRQFVHEYCAHFGCMSEAYDAEPKRNVVAIAEKGKCWLPSYSLLEMVQRAMGQRKIPMPIFNKKSTNTKNDRDMMSAPARVILPVIPNSNSSNGGLNYYGN